jgi:HEAT repeat protein
VELLAADEDFAVRLLLAERHPKAPPELLLDLYLHGTHRAVGMLTARPGFPAAGLAARCADAEDPYERALALRDPAATPELVERLSRDEAAYVRSAAAFDARLPLPRLLELLDDPGVSSSAAANPTLPVAEMTALLDRAGVPR